MTLDRPTDYLFDRCLMDSGENLASSSQAHIHQYLAIFHLLDRSLMGGAHAAI